MAHRKALYRNLVTDLLHYERITTTEAKAKEIRPIAERIITLGRRGDLHSRRQAQRYVFDVDVVRKVFDDIGPRMKERPGGYLRITAMEPRKGDGARMAAIELIDFVDAPATARPQRVTAPAAVAPATAAAPAASPDDAADDAPATPDVTEAEALTAEAPLADAPVEEPEATAEAEEPEGEADEAAPAAESEASEGDATDGDAEEERS